MSISVDLNSLSKAYLDRNGTFKHKTGDRIRIFPFVTNDKSGRPDVAFELKDFRGISGAAIRISTGQDLPTDFDQNSLIKKMSEMVISSNKDIFSGLIKEICFGDGNNVFRFSKKTLLYQKVQCQEKTLNNFAEYISEIFLDNVEINFDDDNPEIVLYKLLHSAIPDLIATKHKKEKNCYRGLQEIRDLFIKDFSFLQQNNKLFINNVDKLLKYYLYYYLTQLAFRLKSFLRPTVDKTALFFSVDWEQLSESREANLYGLKTIQTQVKEIFPHVVCLDLLNHIDGLCENIFTYTELTEKIHLLPSAAKQELLNAICAITGFYKASVKDVPWDVFESEYVVAQPESPILESINKLYRVIEFQFSDSKRFRARDGYGKWLQEFGRQNFGKRRGRLGYTHALTQDYILLFIKLCIGNAPEGKIRLSELWNQFNLRGIYFDLYSQQEITMFLDKNNMLEKKSDSGDAQYVTLQE